MTVNLSIKGVPVGIAAQLRARAERNHRSLQGELMAIVTAAAEGAPPPAPSAPATTTRRGWKTLEQVAAEGRERHRNPVSRFGRSVDLIRRMRDSH